MAKEFAVLGSPIQHSKSPTIHLAAYQALGLDWNYERFEVDKTNFDAFLSSRRLDGASLTMPLKEVAFERFGSANAAG
jgi:shikimate dehydrogenase